MPRVRRSRSVGAPPEAVWRLVSDPHSLPRWWPSVTRVEDASDEAWTKVLATPRGRAVRADYTVLEAEPPRRLVWRQEVEESPFERIFSSSVVEIELEPEGAGGTRVSLASAERLRGRYRLGGAMVRRAARRRLDEALDDLDSAAERVADRIRDASEHGNDGFWDNVGGWVRDHAVLLDRIATWAGRIALALAAITIAVLVFVAAPAALLMSLLFWGALAAGVVQFGAHAAMMASDVEGVTWLDIGLDVLGLVTAGAGQWIGKGLAKAVPLLRSDVAQVADDSARAAQDVLEAGAANYTRAGNATRITDPANPLRQWGQQYLDDAAERVTQAGRQAADDVHAGAVTQAPRAGRVTALDADVARDLAELQRLGGMQLSAPLRQGLDDLVQQGNRAVTFNQVSTGVQLADGTDDLVVEWKDPLVEATSDAYWHLAD